MKNSLPLLHYPLRSTAIALLLAVGANGLSTNAALAGFRGNISRSSINRSSINRSNLGTLNRSWSLATSRTGLTTLQGSSIERVNQPTLRTDWEPSSQSYPRLELEPHPDFGDVQDQRTEVREDWQDQQLDLSEERMDQWEERSDQRQNYWEERSDERQDYWDDNWDDNWYYGWNGDWWYSDDYWNRYYPPGFWLTSIGTTAILIDATNDIYYDSGVYYEPYNEGYTVVTAPVGASVTALPDGFITTPVGNQIYYYYLGTFYIQDATTGNYVVVTPPSGAVVPYLPEGYTTLFRDNKEYYEFAGTYYLPYYVNDQLVFVVTYL